MAKIRKKQRVELPTSAGESGRLDEGVERDYHNISERHYPERDKFFLCGGNEDPTVNPGELTPKIEYDFLLEQIADSEYPRGRGGFI
ncbi:hypothetical protein J4463_04225 [Candidatus Pacearchaeota archaeon]|nr:hypothetical protein [Candidatus Pacearchaeota archaeon]